MVEHIVSHYEPNRFMKWAWEFYSWDTWLFWTVFVFILVLMLVFYKKVLGGLESKFRIFNYGIAASQFLFICSALILILFCGYALSLKPHLNLQTLSWFQTQYPNYAKNELLSECRNIYAIKLSKTPDLVELFVDEMDMCIRNKTRSAYMTAALQEEKQQNQVLLKQQTVSQQPVLEATIKDTSALKKKSK